MERLRDLLRGEKAQTTAEYAILAAVIAIGVIGAGVALATGIRGKFTSITTCLNGTTSTGSGTSC